MSRKPFIVPIPGTRTVDHLRENLGALAVQLTPADTSELVAEFLADLKSQIEANRDLSTSLAFD